MFPSIEKAANVLNVNDFYGNKNKLVYRAMLDLAKIGDTPIDATTVSEALGTDLQRAGGLSYLDSLTNGLPRPDAIGRYVDLVKDKALLRCVINRANAVICSAMNGAGELDEHVEKLSAHLRERVGVERKDLWKTAANLLDDAYQARERGDVNQESEVQDRLAPLLPSALTSGDDELLEMSVYCMSLLEDQKALSALEQAYSTVSDNSGLLSSVTARSNV